MNERIRTHIEHLFENAPETRKALELKDELLGNCNSKYDDLIAEGTDPDDAFRIVAASIGDVDDLLAQLKSNLSISSQEREKKQLQRAILTSIAIGLYILSPIGLFVLHETIGLCILFVMAAVATMLLVFSSMIMPKYLRVDDTMVEEFKEWKDYKNRKSGIRKSVSSILWIFVTIVYILVSFLTGRWEITWVLFLIGGLCEGLIKIYFEMRRK